MSRPIQLALSKNFIARERVNQTSLGGSISTNNFETVVGIVAEHPGDEIDRKNGWSEPHEMSHVDAERAEFVRELVVKECVIGYGEIFYFCYSGASGTLVPINTTENLQVAFRRFVAVTRILFPEVLQDKDGPLSQARVAQLLGKSPTYIADLGTRFSDNWQFYSRVQKTKSEKEASRNARLLFLDTKRTAPKAARKPNGKLVNPLGSVRASSPSSSSLSSNNRRSRVDS